MPRCAEPLPPSRAALFSAASPLSCEAPTHVLRSPIPGSLRSSSTDLNIARLAVPWPSRKRTPAQTFFAWGHFNELGKAT